MQFSEIRSLRKIHRTDDILVSPDNIIEARGIVNPSTGESITVGEAISLRILDVRNGRISTTSSNGRASSVTIEEAARTGLIDPELANRLLGPCGVTEDGRTVSLLEAIQRELFDAERGDDRVKVTYVPSPGVSVADAIHQGNLDPVTGKFVTDSGDLVTIEEAFSRGYLVRLDTKVKIRRGALALSDAISQGLVDERLGHVVDRNTGDSHLLDEAIERGIIDSDIREVVDEKNDSKVTVAEAIAEGILNPKSGKYIHGVSEKLSFKEARRRHLIVKPMTLKDCCDLDIIDESGKISSPASRSRMGILEAITSGVLDADSVRSVTDTRTGELLTLSDALVNGIVVPEGRFRDLAKGEELSIPEAVDRGLITSVAQKSIFDIDGFKDPISGEFISLNSALLKGLVSPKSGGSFVVDLTTGKTVSLNDAIERGEARPEVMEMLNRGIGVTENGVEVSVLEAVLHHLLEPQSGQLLDPRTGRTVPLEEAIKRGLITPDGAALLASLLNITVTTQTVTKTIKKYVTITETGETVTRDYKVAYSEALRRGLVDERTAEYTDPDSGKVMDISEAIREGLIGRPENEIERPSPKKTRDIPSKQMTYESTVYARVGDDTPPRATGTTTTIITHQIVPRGESSLRETTSSITQESTSSRETLVSPTRASGTSTTIITHQVIPGGESTRQNVSPITLESMSSRETSASPTKISHRDDSVNAGISSRVTVKMSPDVTEHSEESRTSYTSESKLYLEKESRTSGKKVFELPSEGWMLSEVIDQQLFDPVAGLFIIPGTDRLVSFEECLKLGIIKPESGVVIDPNNGRKISLLRSLEKNILDSTGHYNHPQKLTMKEAIARELIILEHKTAEVEKANPRLLQITKVTGKPDRVEVRHMDDPSGDTEIANSEELFPSDPVQVSQGVIYDPSTALVIFTETGRSANLLEAINEGTLKPETVVVKDPTTGRDLTVVEAIDRKILDPRTGAYKDGTGRNISLTDAAKFGVVAVLGAPLVAAAAAVEAVKRAMVEDPRTGEKIPREVAVERGLVAPENRPNKSGAVTTTITIKDQQTVRRSSSEETSERGDITTDRGGETTAVRWESPAKVANKSETVNATIMIKDSQTGAEVSVVEALEKGIVTSDLVNKMAAVHRLAPEIASNKSETVTTTILVKDSRTAKKISLDEALERGLVTTDQVNEMTTLSAPETVANNSETVMTTTMTIKDSQTGQEIFVEEALEKGIVTADQVKKMSADQRLGPETVSTTSESITRTTIVIRDPQTGEEYAVDEALQKGIVTEDQVKEMTVAQKSKVAIKIDEPVSTLPITDPQPVKEISPEIVTTDQPQKMAKVTIKIDEPTTTQQIVDAQSLKQNLVEESPEKGIVSADQPKKSEKMSIDEDTNVFDDTDKAGPSLGEMTRNRVTTEPKYKVTIGRARSVSQSPEREAKPIVLQKMRKRIVDPREALETGLIDRETAETLEKLISENENKSASLVESIGGNTIAEKGTIKDPQSGHQVSIKEAIDRGILDSESATMLVPLAKSLSVPGLYKQGLLDRDENKIVHPETGQRLSLNEAIVCEIVDPQTKLSEAKGDSLTLENAILKDVIDGERSLVRVDSVQVNLVEAVEGNVFEPDEPATSTVPPVGMTFALAVKRGLVDLETREVTHPITGERMPLEEAIEKDFIMALPYPVAPESVLVAKALEDGLIDEKNSTFLNPKTGKSVPIAEAMESGLLVVKDDPGFASTVAAVTETVTSYHTMTTKTVAIMSGYVLISSDEVRNTKTGEVISIIEAQRRGIVKDESETREQFTTKDVKTTFSEAVEAGIVDMDAGTYTDPETGKTIPIAKAIASGILDTSAQGQTSESPKKAVLTILDADQLYDEETKKFLDPETNKSYDLTEAMEAGLIEPDSIVYDVKSSETITTKQAVDRGLLDPKTGKLKNDQGDSMSVSEAAKLGLLAVVATPVLAGMAVVDAIKGRKTGERKPTMSPVKESSPLREARVPAENIPDSQEHPGSRPIQTTLGDAIENDLIDPKTCRLIVGQRQIPHSIEEALERQEIHRNEVVVILSRNQVCLIDERQRYRVPVSRDLTPQSLAEEGAYDLESDKFVDPETGDTVAFHDFVRHLEILDPDNVWVKDLSSRGGEYVSLREAIDRPLVDRNAGYMVDPKTGKKIPFFEAIQLGLIVHRPPAQDESLALSLKEAIEAGVCDPSSGALQDPRSGQTLTLANAVEAGLIDPDSVSIRNPANDEVLSLYEAVEAGVVDLQRGVIINVETRTEIDIKVAFLKGLVVPGLRKPIALEAIINKGLYDPDSGQIQDPLTKQKIDLEEGVRRGIVDAFITECRDTKSGSFVSLDDAISSSLVTSGRLRDTKAGTLLSLDVALAKRLIVTTSFVPTLIDVIVQEYYSPKTGLVLNPMIGDEVTVNEALTSGFVDGSKTRVRDERRDRVVTLREAQETRLLDLDKGVLLVPHSMALDTALEKGYILSTTKPWSLQQALAHQSYNPKTGAFLIDGDRLTLEAAIGKGLVSLDGPSIKDPRSGDVISLGDAIKHGLIDPKTGMAVDPSTGTPMTLIDALDRGLVVPAKRKISLPEAVFKGFYDPKTGQFTSPETRERLPTDRAIKEGVIDPSSAIVRDLHGDLITFDRAIRDRVVDPKSGTIATERGGPVDFQEAFERGLLLETRRPMTFSEAILKGILDPKTGLFLDPKSGAYLTVLQTIQRNLIDAESVYVKDPKTGFSKKITLAEAIRMGYVDGTTGKVKDFTRNNLEISLHEAYEIGLVIDNKAAVSLQRAIHQGLYDDKTGKITDPANGRAVTLHEAMRKCVISPKLACYWDKRNESLLSLAETCRAGVIDRRSGMFKEPGANNPVALSVALHLGLIVDIESAGFGLYEALHMGLYDSPSGKFVNPSTNRKLTLAESCREDLVNPLISVVKNTRTSRYILLEEAIAEKIVDDDLGIYRLLDLDKVIDLQEAKKRGLVVPARKPLSVEEAVKCGLYRGDSGKFVDPTANEFHDLSQALENGLLDADTTAMKDATTGQIKSLLEGIEDGNIDVSRGRVLDAKSKRAYNIDVALERGLLVSVDKPLTQQGQRKTSLELRKEAIKTKGLRECSLEEALKYELLDPDTAVLKDPRNGRFITVAKALEDGVVDPASKGVIEPRNGKTISRCIKFEDTTVFLSEPTSFETAVEKGYLDLESAKYTDSKTGEVLTVKEAVALGVVDPDSALIKDRQKRKLVKLVEAFRKGIMDGEKGNVLDTATSKLHTLPKAVETGLLTTQKQGLSLIESLQFGIYNPTTGGFHDPFSVTSVLDRKRLNLGEAIESGLVDPSTTVIKDPISGRITSLLEAISEGRVDSVAGRFREDTDGKDIDLVKALERGFVLAAEARVSQCDTYIYIFFLYRHIFIIGILPKLVGRLRTIIA